MRRILVAIQAMLATLVGSVSVESMARLLAGELSAAGEPTALGETVEHEKSRGPADLGRLESNQGGTGRSEAVTLLAALQREARWLDLVQEDLDNYSDSQVGAAARNVLRDCRTVLDRIFDLRPVIAQDEGTEVETPAVIDAVRWQLSGKVVGTPPYRGRLVHRGWEAGRVELPRWTGDRQNGRMIAPAEVEVG